jgi:hypothetical protein
MQSEKYDYGLKHLERDLTSGGLRGGILGICYGIVFGAYYSYNQDQTPQFSMKNWAKFTMRSTAGFVPMLGLSAVTYKYANSKDLGEGVSMMITILVTGILFEVGKKVIH